jgi:predicted AAA+ superfamily ATPase
MILKSDIWKIYELQTKVADHADTGVMRELLGDFKITDRFACILSGIRRCGKSTLLYQLRSRKYKDVFYLNFDDNRLYGFDNNDFQRLDELITETGSRLLFFDELQEIQGWERYVRQKLDENYNVVITGSNASLMSRELGTKLTGRHLDSELFPFSYAEYLQATKTKEGEESVRDYLDKGGFPAFIKSGDERVLSDLFEDILLRDIILRNGIRDVKGLQRLALWLISNISNLVTATGLKQVAGISATSTIMEYFSHLESSYLFHFVPRFSYSVRSRMVSPRKVYCADNGLITVNSGSFSDDRGRKLENAVFVNLRKRHKTVFYFSDKQECDFIVMRRGEKPLIIQSCYEINRDNMDRELGGLFEALAFFETKEGTIVTLNQTDNFTKDGMIVNVIPAWEFLQTREIKK